MNLWSVSSAVTRMGWWMTPATISSRRISPAKIGRPAASAEVHVLGRRALDRRSHTAPEPPWGSPPFQSKSKIS
jgi:hypothetical protein